MSRKDKYTWQSSEVEVTLSQCSNCLNNKGFGKCKAYGDKPTDYKDNKRKCPSHKS